MVNECQYCAELRQIVSNDDSHDQVLTVAAYFHDIAKGLNPIVIMAQLS